MIFFQNVLQVMDTKMETPTLYGWFHILFLGLTVLATVFLCVRFKNASAERVNSIVFFTALTVVLLEVYKMINYSFSYEDGISFDFEWYAFPFQFCSTPMYVGMLCGFVPKGKVRDALYAYLATYSIFAGAAVMLYPGDVFIRTVGINIQTMICHGSMIVIGVYLLYSGAVKLSHKTILKAAAVFTVAIGIAMVLNEVIYYSGILEEGETFNMFYISRHYTSTLPVYSEVQKLVPYPWNLILYIWGFTTASYLILLLAKGINGLAKRKVSVK